MPEQSPVKAYANILTARGFTPANRAAVSLLPTASMNNPSAVPRVNATLNNNISATIVTGNGSPRKCPPAMKLNPELSTVMICPPASS